MTLNELAHRYAVERWRRGEFTDYSKRTVTSVLGGFVRHVGDGPPARLTRRAIERWLEDRAALSPTTRRNQLATVKAWCKWLVLNDHLRRDPSLGIKGPRQPRQVPRSRNAEEVARLLAHLPDARAHVIVLLMVQEGLRCGEVARLEIGDVDLLNRAIVVLGKGGHERALPLSDETRRAIVAYLAEHPGTGGPLVRRFDRWHTGLKPHYVSDLVRKWMRDAGVKGRPYDGVSGHSLRHTAATDMLRHGAHVRDVQAALGHASLVTTQRYMPTIVNDLREAMGGRAYRGEVRSST